VRARAGEILDEVDREAEGVVQAEHLLAGHDARAARGTVEHVFEARQTRGEHRVEPFLFRPDGADDRIALTSTS
jgi:hypothetical protein